MKPSNEQYYVAVLNQQSELEVVLGYIQSHAYLSKLPASNRQVMEGLAPLREMINPASKFYNVTEYDKMAHKSIVKKGAEKPLGSIEASIAFVASMGIRQGKPY